MNYLLTLMVFTLFTLSTKAQTLKEFIHHEKNTSQTVIKPKPYYQGEVVQVLQAKAYTYLEIKESTNLTFWIVTNKVDAQIGDFVRFQQELVTKNFKSIALNKVFNELMFVSHLQYKKSSSN